MVGNRRSFRHRDGIDLNGRLTVQSTATNLISTWSDPFNFGAANPCGTPRGILCVVRPLVLTDQVDRKTPYVDQYELSVERQLSSSTAVEVSFLGTEGHELQRWINLANQPVPGITAVADRSPFPEFGLFQGAANVGYSHYKSLGVKLTRRYSAGLTVLGAYTLSKSTDNGSGIRVIGTDPLNPQNSYCFMCEHGLSVFDQRHRLVTSVVYDLPFGPGRKFLNDYSHSWNGKFRRPVGLATPDYQEPMKGELLWVYEGLTQYLGTLFPARAGWYTPEQYRRILARAKRHVRHGRPQ